MVMPNSETFIKIQMFNYWQNMIRLKTFWTKFANLHEILQNVDLDKTFSV